MPLDALTPTRPDLTTPSLTALAWMLDHEEDRPYGPAWDFTHTDCCAMGIARRQWDLLDFHHARSSAAWGADAFGISDHDAYLIFIRAARPPEMSASDVTSGMVAAAIRAVLEKNHAIRSNRA